MNTVESSNRLSISWLKEKGYLKPNNLTTGKLTWHYQGQPVAQIKIIVSTLEDHEYIRLIYRHSSSSYTKDYNYTIPLQSVSSNLGIGFRYYFLCPFTHKRCHVLYKPLNGFVWAHRDYHKLKYHNQQLSRRDRLLDSLHTYEHRLEYYPTKFLKRHYRGEITPRMKQIQYYAERVEELDKRWMEGLLRYLRI